MGDQRGLVRLRAVRRGDVLDDQKGPSQIASANASSVTQEEYQQYILSQIKRIIHGDDPGQWCDDFLAANIPSLGSALDATEHEGLRQLIHFVDEGPAHGFASGAFKEITGTPWPSAVTWWVDSTRTKKIVEQIIVRNAQQSPTLVTWNAYAADGTTVVESVVDTITNDPSGAFEISRTRAIA